MRASPFSIALLLVPLAHADLYPPMQPPFVTWVQDGKPLARIITDTFPDGTTQPVAVLNERLKRITGVELPVVQKAEGDTPILYLGPVCAAARVPGLPLTDLGTEGFLIHSEGRDLILAGQNRLSTLYAVFAFLEECLGVRWFWAHPTGEYWPTTNTLQVGQVRTVRKPAFALRWIGRGEWGLAQRMNVGINQPGELKTKFTVHTWLYILPPEKFWKDHPEFYAERGGQRQDPTNDKRVQLCTSNPAVVEAVAQSIDEIVRQEPDIRMISVDPMDSQNFCQCGSCGKLEDAGEPYARRNSRRVWSFVNQVAERIAARHPNLLLKCIAYHTYLAAPKDPGFKLHPNVVIQFCRFMCHNHALNDPTCPVNVEFNQHYQAWRKLTTRIIFYEYYFKVSWLHLPWPIVHTLKQELPYLRDQGLMGIYTQYTTNFVTHALGYYVAAKLLWNPDLDVDALVDDFCQKAFGEAAEPMRRYYRRLERTAIESGAHIAEQRPYSEALALFTPAVLAELDADMKQALAVVKEPATKARVELVAKGLEYTHLVMTYLQALAQVGDASGADRWFGGVTGEGQPPGLAATLPLAEAIGAYLADPANLYAVGRNNTYIEPFLKPDTALRQWQRMAGGSGIVLTKAQWLKDRPQPAPGALPERFDLWVYGNDLYFEGDAPEHTLYAKLPGGERKALGTLATKERPGNRANRCYILHNLTPELLVDGKLSLVITNDPGGPYASSFFAFYLMPPGQATDDDATARIQRDLESVRREAFGFSESGYGGLYGREDAPLEVEVRVEPPPA